MCSFRFTKNEFLLIKTFFIFLKLYGDDSSVTGFCVYVLVYVDNSELISYLFKKYTGESIIK